MKLTAKEAEQARIRRRDYIRSMAIEGIELTEEQRLRIAHIEAERMDADEAVRYIISRAKERGVIPADAE